MVAKRMIERRLKKGETINLEIANFKNEPTMKDVTEIGAVGTVLRIVDNVIILQFNDDWFGFYPINLKVTDKKTTDSKISTIKLIRKNKPNELTNAIIGEKIEEIFPFLFYHTPIFMKQDNNSEEHYKAKYEELANEIMRDKNIRDMAHSYQSCPPTEIESGKVFNHITTALIFDKNYNIIGCGVARRSVTDTFKLNKGKWIALKRAKKDMENRITPTKRNEWVKINLMNKINSRK